MKRLRSGWRARLLGRDGKVLDQGEFAAMVVALDALHGDDRAMVLLPHKPESRAADETLTLH